MNIRTHLFKRLDNISLPPLVPWAILYCLGIVFESYCHAAFYLIFSMALSCASLGISLLKKRGWSHFFLWACAFFIGALALANSRMPAHDSIVRLTRSVKQTVQVKGIVITEPAVLDKKISFVLGVSGLKKGGLFYKVSGGLLVQCYQKLDLDYGDELILEGSLHMPFAFLSNKGTGAVLSVKKSGSVERIGTRKGSRLKHLSLDLKRRLKNTISSSLGAFSAMILEGILLGEQGAKMRPVREMMVRTGTWHIMVVSGSHTALLAFIFLLFFKAIRIPRLARFLLTITFLIAYCFLTGSSGPVVRATVMTIVILFSYLIERNPIFYNGLALAALFILFFDPSALFNIGFQLSFLSVFFIVWLFPIINGIFKLSYFSVSLCAWIGTAPLLAGVFGSFSLITVPANMVIVPLAMLVVTSGFVLAVLGSFSLCLATLISWPVAASVEFFILLLLKINSLFCSLPFAFYEFPGIPKWLVFGLYILIFSIFARHKYFLSFYLKYKR